MTDTNTIRSQPKPGSWVKSSPTVSSEASPKEKKPFVPKPHLTDRPFKENPELRKLRDSMQKPVPEKFRKNARRK